MSEPNARGHWAKRSKRAKEQRTLACMALRFDVSLAASWIGEPLVVTLTRLGPRTLDDDNIRGALKAVRDGVADVLRVNDNDPRVEWRYAQERSAAYAVRVEIAAREQLRAAGGAR